MLSAFELIAESSSVREKASDAKGNNGNKQGN